MREFKFRQWNSFSNNFHYFSWKDGLVEGMFSASLKENPVMQWTGLTDKNGKDIYEGDILGTKNSDPDFDIWSFNDHDLLVVKWDNEYSCFYNVPDLDSDSVYHHDFIEVIGNIYENPELLEE